MFCKYCGENVEDNSKFCQHCGAKLEENNINSTNPITPSKGPSSLEVFVNPLSFEKDNPVVWLWLLPVVDIIISSIYASKSNQLNTSTNINPIDITLGVFKFSTTLILLLSAINFFTKFYV